jgi:hypothetical protein
MVTSARAKKHNPPQRPARIFQLPEKGDQKLWLKAMEATTS